MSRGNSRVKLGMHSCAECADLTTLQGLAGVHGEQACSGHRCHTQQLHSLPVCRVCWVLPCALLSLAQPGQAN